jgi:sn-glycerol 3-phosphate transport system permease protein
MPGVRPTTTFVAVTSFLASMQAFDLVYVMTQGGPLDGTRTLSYQIYDEAFVRFRVGTASAVSTILFVVLLIVTILQVRVMDRKQ